MKQHVALSKQSASLLSTLAHNLDVARSRRDTALKACEEMVYYESQEEGLQHYTKQQIVEAKEGLANAGFALDIAQQLQEIFGSQSTSAEALTAWYIRNEQCKHPEHQRQTEHVLSCAVNDDHSLKITCIFQEHVAGESRERTFVIAEGVLSEIMSDGTKHEMKAAQDEIVARARKEVYEQLLNADDGRNEAGPSETLMLMVYECASVFALGNLKNIQLFPESAIRTDK